MNINKNFVDNNNGEIYMKKIIVSVLLVLLVGVSTIMGTYAVIINVVSDNGVDKIVNVINIKDLLSDDNGNYNSTYYDVRDELNISDSEMDVLMNSSYLNDSLKIVLDNVVSYKLRGGTKLSNDDIYNMIVNDVNNDDSINNILKNKVIDKSNVYRTLEKAYDDLTALFFGVEGLDVAEYRRKKRMEKKAARKTGNKNGAKKTQ